MEPRLHPAHPDESGLSEFIKEMPGGEYVGEQWKHEEHVLVAVTVGPYDDPHRTLALVMAAHPAHTGPGPEPSREEGNYVLLVGRTALRILEWYADEGSHSVEALDLPSWSGGAQTYAAELAAVWDLESTAEEAEDRLRGADDVADETGTRRAVVLEVTTTLWADQGHEDWDGALDKARAVLASTA